MSASVQKRSSVVASSWSKSLLLYNYTTATLEEDIEDTKGVIRIRISKKNRQHNGQRKKYKKDKQRSTKHAHKAKDWVTWTPLKIGGEHRFSGRVNSSWNECLQHGRYVMRHIGMQCFLNGMYLTFSTMCNIMLMIFLRTLTNVNETL